MFCRQPWISPLQTIAPSDSSSLQQIVNVPSLEVQKQLQKQLQLKKQLQLQRQLQPQLQLQVIFVILKQLGLEQTWPW
jgi:hypothetical protein